MPTVAQEPAESARAGPGAAGASSGRSGGVQRAARKNGEKPPVGRRNPKQRKNG